MDKLEGKLVRLRALEPEDVDVLYKWENDTTIWRVSNTVAPFSKYVLRQFIEDQSRDIYETKQLRLIIESIETKQAVGAIDLFDLDPYNLRSGIGILIYEQNDQGRGYASEAITILTLYCFHILMLNQLWCNIPALHQRSLALFKSKGFTTIGLKKEWTRTTADWEDEYMLQLINPKKP